MSEMDVRREIKEYERLLCEDEKALQVRKEEYLKALKNVSKPWLYFRTVFHPFTSLPWGRSEDYVEHKCTDDVYTRFGNCVKHLKEEKNRLENLLAECS